jgi:uncharacterized protein (TIGR02453 family)
VAPRKKISAEIESASSARPCFTPPALEFLRKLKRNNRREWFEARRHIYERELKSPMLSVIERLTNGMVEYAPDHIRPPHKCMLRIYRDTRFSSDKTPYKTHLSAWWTRNGLEKTSGAGYYLSLSATELVIAAGVYMPPPEQLIAIRRHLLHHHSEFQRLIEARRLRSKFSLHDPRALTRPPKGFPADHPAIDFIKWRQWGVTATLPASEAFSPNLAATIEQYFRLAAPLLAFLNQPLLHAASADRKAVFRLY